MKITSEQLEQIVHEQLFPPGYCAVRAGHDKHALMHPDGEYMLRGSSTKVGWASASLFSSLDDARRGAWAHFEEFGGS